MRRLHKHGNERGRVMYIQSQLKQPICFGFGPEMCEAKRYVSVQDKFDNFDAAVT
jgi:hypothetical protein